MQHAAGLLSSAGHVHERFYVATCLISSTVASEPRAAAKIASCCLTKNRNPTHSRQFSAWSFIICAPQCSHHAVLVRQPCLSMLQLHRTNTMAMLTVGSSALSRFSSTAYQKAASLNARFMVASAADKDAALPAAAAAVHSALPETV